MATEQVPRSQIKGWFRWNSIAYGEWSDAVSDYTATGKVMTDYQLWYAAEKWFGIGAAYQNLEFPWGSAEMNILGAYGTRPSMQLLEALAQF